MKQKSVQEILDDPDFRALASQKNAISLTLTVLELSFYFGFIALIAFCKPFLSQKLTGGGATTIGIPIAIATIVLSWVLTGIYIYWANNTYDTLVRRVRDKIGE